MVDVGCDVYFCVYYCITIYMYAKNKKHASWLRAPCLSTYLLVKDSWRKVVDSPPESDWLTTTTQAPSMLLTQLCRLPFMFYSIICERKWLGSLLYIAFHFCTISLLSIQFFYFQRNTKKNLALPTTTYNYSIHSSSTSPSCHDDGRKDGGKRKSCQKVKCQAVIHQPNERNQFKLTRTSAVSTYVESWVCYVMNIYFYSKSQPTFSLSPFQFK